MNILAQQIEYSGTQTCRRIRHLIVQPGTVRSYVYIYYHLANKYTHKQIRSWTQANKPTNAHIHTYVHTYMHSYALSVSCLTTTRPYTTTLRSHVFTMQCNTLPDIPTYIPTYRHAHHTRTKNPLHALVAVKGLTLICGSLGPAQRLEPAPRCLNPKGYPVLSDALGISRFKPSARKCVVALSWTASVEHGLLSVVNLLVRMQDKPSALIRYLK